MEQRIYNYLDKTKIAIESNGGLLDRIERNIEEKGISVNKFSAQITIGENDHPIEIIKDKRYEYQSFRVNNSRPYQGWDYFSYGTHVRTIWKSYQNNFQVETNVSNDEASGLICFRNLVYGHPVTQEMILIHGSLVEIDGKGILIAGDVRTGKTLLLMHFLEEYGATFISDENVLLSNEDGILIGNYIPRTIRVRFEQINDSPLKFLLKDFKQADATQYIDPDAIEKIINERAFNVDAGMALSRKQVVESFEVASKAKSRIGRIIFTEYSPENSKQKSLTPKEARTNLEKMIREKKTEINHRELNYIAGQIPFNWLKGISAEKLKFRNRDDLLEMHLNG